jgi:hypothetical protein
MCFLGEATPALEARWGAAQGSARPGLVTDLLTHRRFFSRVLHSHPGRVVWIFFNVGIALCLMEAGVFGFLNTVLGFYSNVAIAWVGALVADLVIDKPLGLSPSYVEFKRAHLYPVNPVGSMMVATGVSVAAYFHAFNETLLCLLPLPGTRHRLRLVPPARHCDKRALLHRPRGRSANR